MALVEYGKFDPESLVILLRGVDNWNCGTFYRGKFNGKKRSISWCKNTFKLISVLLAVNYKKYMCLVLSYNTSVYSIIKLQMDSIYTYNTFTSSKQD